MGKFEVTFAQWDACAAEGGCKHKPHDETWGRGQRPVINVSWHDARQFVAWLSGKPGKAYRLPTEAEWEYAARAIADASAPPPFSTGSTINYKQANYDANFTYGDGKMGLFRQKTMEVGRFPKNAFGLHDMHGNVWEWVQDCYKDSYHGAPTDGSAVVQPGCGLRILRGGSWNYFPQLLRSAYRYATAPDIRLDIVGFRVARSARCFASKVIGVAVIGVSSKVQGKVPPPRRGWRSRAGVASALLISAGLLAGGIGAANAQGDRDGRYWGRQDDRDGRDWGRQDDRDGRDWGRQRDRDGRERGRQRAAADKPMLAIVSLNDQRITIYSAAGKMLEAPVSTGSTGYETPAGIFSIVQKKEDHRSNLYEDGEMPFMQRITWTGIALHAGNLPGHPASHGCVRLPMAFARQLFDLTDLGMRVVIVRDDMRPSPVTHPALFKSMPLPKELALAGRRSAKLGGAVAAGDVAVGSTKHLQILKSLATAKTGELETAAQRHREARAAAGRLRPKRQPRRGCCGPQRATPPRPSAR